MGLFQNSLACSYSVILSLCQNHTALNAVAVAVLEIHVIFPFYSSFSMFVFLVLLFFYVNFRIMLSSYNILSKISWKLYCIESMLLRVCVCVCKRQMGAPGIIIHIHDSYSSLNVLLHISFKNFATIYAYLTVTILCATTVIHIIHHKLYNTVHIFGSNGHTSFRKIGSRKYIFTYMWLFTIHILVFTVLFTFYYRKQVSTWSHFPLVWITLTYFLYF